MVAIKRAILAMVYRLRGQQGPAAQECTKAAARERLLEQTDKQAREAVAAYGKERAAVTAVARNTISLIARANARLS